MVETTTYDTTRDAPALSRLGVLLVTASTLAFSTTGFFTRLITVDAWTILFWLGLFGALFIAIYVVWEHRHATYRVVSAMGWPGVVVMVASTVTMVAYIPALKLTTVANATLIAATVPFCTALLAWTWLRERPTASAVLASTMALLGVVVMVSGSTRAGSRWGDGLAVVANVALPAPGLFRLLTPKAHAILNSSFANMPRQRREQGRPTLTINAADARARGLIENPEVLVKNHQAVIRAWLHVTEDIRPGVVALPGKWWSVPPETGAVGNLLTPSSWSPGGQPAFNDMFVEVTAV